MITSFYYIKKYYNSNNNRNTLNKKFNTQMFFKYKVTDNLCLSQYVL